MIKSKFRAIIIGGGPVGLAIANGLDRAGLDFLIVERHPTMTPDSGAGISEYIASRRCFLLVSATSRTCISFFSS